MINSTAEKPLALNSAPQLLIDDYLVDDIWMIRRSPELPVKSLDNPIFQPRTPFADASYGATSLVCDEEQHLFRMWYSLATENANSLAYAVSEDDLHWDTPSLGLVEYKGSSGNNLCLGLGGQSLRVDSRCP